MKIHVWGINYSPEVTGIAPYNAVLCDFLKARGHSVRMVTSFCYYPAWQKLPGERRTLFRTDLMDGVPVHRCWQYVPKQVTTWGRILHEISFALTSFVRQLFLPRPDLIIVISPPLLLGWMSWLLCLCKRTSFFFHVQDLQPDAAERLGMVRDNLILLRGLKSLERFAYAKAARVSAITPGMLRNLETKNVPSEKLLLFPNGVELPDFWRLPDKNRFRKSQGISEGEFLVVYSGNLGRKQGLDQLLHAASLVKCPRTRFVICGDGAERARLESQAAALKLAAVTFLPLLSEPRYRELLVDADLSIIPQQPSSGPCFFPSKLLKTLAFGSPVLAITECGSELDRAVLEGGFGLSIAPGNPAAIAAAIENLSTKKEELREYSRAGFKFVKRFEQGAILEEFARVVEAFRKEKRLVKQPAAQEQGGTETPSCVSKSSHLSVSS